MRSRENLLEDTVKVLDSHDFEVLVYVQSCLDVAAQHRSLKLLLKVLGNIDGFRAEHAGELRRLSACLDACPVLVGESTKTAHLQNDAVYERYGVPSMTLATFSDALDGVFPETLRSKGREIVQINGTAMKQARTRLGMSRSRLAAHLGVSKETVYMYEHGGMRMRRDTAKQLEDMLHAKIIVTQTPFGSRIEGTSMPQDRVQEKLRDFGFDLYPFRKMNFDVVAKDEKNKVIVRESIPRDAAKMAQFSDFFKALLALVSEESIKPKVPEMPVIGREEIFAASSKQDFINLLREKAG